MAGEQSSFNRSFGAATTRSNVRDSMPMAMKVATHHHFLTCFLWLSLCVRMCVCVCARARARVCACVRVREGTPMQDPGVTQVSR
jgi:hypothetical protein